MYLFCLPPMEVRARPWLKAVDFSLLVGACVAFLGGMADSCVARCAQPMHGSHSRPGGLFAAFGC